MADDWQPLPNTFEQIQTKTAQGPWQNRDTYVIGEIPRVKGCLLTGLIGQDLFCQQQLVNHPHIVFLQMNGSNHWYRIFIDGPQIYFQEVDVSDTFAIQDYGISALLHDLGAELDLIGIELTCLYIAICNGLPNLSLTFSDGRQITFSAGTSDKDSWSGYELAFWSMASH